MLGEFHNNNQCMAFIALWRCFYQYLTSEGGIVDLHVELQTLVLGLTADALADS